MHICLICTEIFAWGKFGGFGRSTRLIGKELANRGIEVSALVPRRLNQKSIEILDGITVYGFDIKKPIEMMKILKRIDADIYHSEEPSLITFFVRLVHPSKKHIITFQDTRLLQDWWIEFKYPSLNKLQVLFNYLYEDNFLVHWIVRNSDGNFAAAKMLINKSVQKYKLSTPPEFLPTPVEFPSTIEKNQQPIVVYLARWDRRKRPELVLALAKKFPSVKFIMLGSSRDKKYGEALVAQIKEIPNIELTGFINQFENTLLDSILSKSWILVNTAAREGLPNSFFECLAYKIAILSSVNSDGFSSKYGYFAQNDDFEYGLNYLLENNRWMDLGEEGYQYVFDTFRTEPAINKHISIYKKILNSEKI